MRLRFLLAVLVLFSSIAYWAYDSVAESLDRRYREVVEELMVDQAQLLAAGLSSSWDLESLQTAVAQSKKAVFKAKIYDLVKTKVGSISYVTDSNGVVLFHSKEPSLVGQDFSRWRDVFLTLQGKYGARSTRDHAEDEMSSVLYVAAPIVVDGKIQGVLSVGKPVRDWQTLLDSAVWSVQKGTLLLVGLGVLFSFMLSFWVFSPLRRIRRFIQKEDLISHQGGDEISYVTSALSNLQADLQAKQYVENYVQILTHELKSPISAIMGSAEILESGPDSETQKKFTQNISSEARRMQLLVETILKVARLELSNDEIESSSTLSQVIHMVEDALAHASFDAQVSIKKEFDFSGGSSNSEEFLVTPFQLDAVLLSQSLINLLLNAIQYSPEGSQIIWKQWVEENTLHGEILDEGPGIPDYAVGQIFEKFYSLKKPRTGKKGTGLGLPFVKEVFRLHGARVHICNRSEGGVKVSYEIPLVKCD